MASKFASLFMQHIYEPHTTMQRKSVMNYKNINLQLTNISSLLNFLRRGFSLTLSRNIPIRNTQKTINMKFQTMQIIKRINASTYEPDQPKYTSISLVLNDLKLTLDSLPLTHCVFPCEE